MSDRITARSTALTVLGAVIGAGFASGQEVMQFFVVLGTTANWAVVVSAIGFVIVTLVLTRASLQHQASSYDGLLAALGGSRAGQFFRHIFALFLLVGLIVMISGSGTLLSGVLPIPKLLAALATALLVYIVSRQNAEGLARANELLMPCLIFLVLFFLLRSWSVSVAPAVTHDLKGGLAWPLSGLLYVAFNSAILLVVIPPLVTRASSRKQAYAGVLGGIALLCCLLLVVVYLLNRFQGLASLQEIPLLAIARYLVPSLPFLYAIPLWIALATTAFADAMGLADYLKECFPTRANRLFVALLALSAILAQFGFARLVALLYPLMGYACLGFYLYCLGRWLLKSLTA